MEKQNESNMNNKPKTKNGRIKRNLKDKKAPNIISRTLFCWLIPLFHTGSRRDLDEYDLVKPLDKYFSARVGNKLEENWLAECQNAVNNGKKPSLLKTLFKTFYFKFLLSGTPIAMILILKTYQPMLFARLLTYWTVDTPLSREDAVIYACALVLVCASQAYLTHHNMLALQQFGMTVRVATSSLMFRKMMRMSVKSLGETAAGKVVNLLSNDVSRFDQAFMWIHYLVLTPFQLFFVTYLMYTEAGISAILGIIVMSIIILPIQGGLSKLLARMRSLAAVRTDKRIKVMDEIIAGIQVIKMYAWETPFADVVASIRSKEMRSIMKANVVRVTSAGFMIITERTSLFVCILIYSLLGNQATASMVFPLQQFYNTVQLALGVFIPLGITFTSEMYVSVKRVEEFLMSEERSDLMRVSHDANYGQIVNLHNNNKMLSVVPVKYTLKNEFSYENKGYEINENLDRVQVEFNDVTANWVEDKPVLKNISFRVKPGKLYALIGSVGSGKSTILQMLLRELPPTSGSVSVNGSISYASQEPWLFPSSVRENIIFGQSYDPLRYKKVCKYCCLEKDFKQFQYGDQTLVGERGVSLSGGQRARINLARAVYRESDIYLLDDPLSAVDANVGKQLYEGCISGYLRGKTRILVTHQIHYLKTADVIIVINDGEIENMASYDDLIKTDKQFAQLLAAMEEAKDKDNESLLSFERSISRRDSVISETLSVEMEAQTIAPEERATGRLGWNIVVGFWGASGICLMITSLIAILLSQASSTTIDFWISYWMNHVSDWQISGGNITEIGFDSNVQMGSLTNGQYLMIYGFLVAANILIVNLRNVSYVKMCTKASKALHDKMFSSMLLAVMRFFDTSSSGRILNRFSKDMGAVDELLPRCMIETIQIYLTLASILVLNAVALPLTLVSTAVLLTVFVLLMRMYLSTSQAVKRLEGTTKSPVFGIVSSSLNGIATIRSLGVQEQLIEDFDEAQDVHTFAWNTYLGGGVGFGFFMDTMCIVYIILILATFLFIDIGDVIPIGNVGLAVSQSLILMLMLQFGARNNVEMIGQMTSVERIMEYTNLETEQNLKKGKRETPNGWPNAGRIVFDNVSMSYSPDALPVLKNLKFTVEAGHKVGIVGRTGAGKSSLISAIFRFANIDGTVSIDGIDTDLIAKQDLRSKISIIPQEPVLFSATIRYNLDPFNLSTDEEIWRALEQVELKDEIASLDFKVSEGGSNFSVGQRQLVCLARAVLRSNKILIMDEATANVDPQTDAFIQKTIRTQFRDCTVLTIAHRLNTIMDSDMVLVMDTGEAVEYDHPFLLLENENSKLTSMAKETGHTMYLQLRKIAKDAFNKD